jgi:hypothetical protein
MKGIPKKFAVLRDLPIVNDAIKEIYPNPMRWDDILSATIEAGKWNIIQSGGYLEKGILYIPYQTPSPAPLEQSGWVEHGK